MEDAIRVRCGKCGALVPSEDLNVLTAVARCPACANVFSFEVKPKLPAPVLAAPRHADLAVPAGMTVTYEAAAKRVDAGYRDGLERQRIVMVRRWFTPEVWLHVALCVVGVCVAIGLVGYAFMIASAGPAIAAGMVLIIVAFITRDVVASFANETRIDVEPGLIRAHTGPYKASFVEIESRLIEQVSVVQIKDGEGGVRFSLVAELRSGRQVELLGPLRDPYPAQYVERAIEDYLSIDDVPNDSSLERVRVRPRASGRGSR